MKRVLVALLGLFAGIAGADVKPGTVKQLGSVDLTATVLDRLASDDPIRYTKITAILDAAGSPACESEATRLLKVSQELAHLRCSGSLILTSYPEKRHVYFVLEGVAYSSRVVMRYEDPKLRKVDPGR